MPYSRLSTGRPSSRVGVHGVVALLLEAVGTDLVAEADAATLVAAQVDQHAEPLPVDGLHRGVELHTAVAAQRVEDVTGEALRVHTHEHVVLALHRTADHGHVLLVRRAPTRTRSR